ncbi:MAG: TrkA family potassium uptake protein [Fimbriimonadaceae bacterium]|nr:TrkA family potassium uptake protein [Fimbriimonadaceae bacterium]
MFVVIAGGGRTGSHLASVLHGQGYRVRLIEDRAGYLTRLHRELPTEVIFEGDPTDPAVLEAAGIREADALAACRPLDADNLVICYFARTIYGVGRIIGRINTPSNGWLYDQKFCVDVALSQPEILARMIEEEMVLGDMVTLLKLQRGEYSLVEERIQRGAPVIGQALKDLSLPEHCVVVAILRDGEVVVPRGQTVFEVDDEVLALTDRPGAEQLVRLFEAPEGASAN